MFKRLKNHIRFLHGLGFWNYKYLKFAPNSIKGKNIFIDEIQKAIKDFIKEHKIQVIHIPFVEMNKNVADKNNYAVGRFIYLEYQSNIIKEQLENKNPKLSYPIAIDVKVKNKLLFLPRIELTEKADIFTYLHELGHFYIYLNGEEQTEEKANYFIYIFLKNYLPEFFLWVFQTSIEVYCKVKINYTEKESFNYYKQTLNFIKNGNKIN